MIATDIFIPTNDSLRDVSMEKVISSIDATSMNNIGMFNPIKKVILENSKEDDAKIDIEITLELFNRIMENIMDPNNKIIPQIPIDLFNDLIDSTTHLVDRINVEPTVTIVESLTTQ
jgi:hypothetical protein